jgi:hypothetical protein
MGCARGFLRNNDGQFLKWEERAGIWGEKAYVSQFFGFLSGWVGRFPVLGQVGRNCFGNNPPKKGVFFIQSPVLAIVFLRVVPPEMGVNERVLGQFLAF